MKCGNLIGFCIALWVALLLSGPAWSACTPDPSNPQVRFETVLGDYEVELCQIDAPNTVDNFMAYVISGLYTTDGFVHRHGTNNIDIIQGGGYWVDQLDPEGPKIYVVPHFTPVDFEVTGHSNLRGTIAMARLAEPDSATHEWFINVTDNVNLDTAGGGYAVFGYVTSGISVVDDIAAQGIWNAGAPLNELPLVSYTGSGSAFPYFVYVNDLVPLPEPGLYLQLGVCVAFLAVASRRRQRRVGSPEN